MNLAIVGCYLLFMFVFVPWANKNAGYLDDDLWHVGE